MSGQTIVLLIIWIVSGIAGVEFLRSAFRDHGRRQDTRLGAAVNEIRFRFRLIAGLLLLLFVGSGVVWMVMNYPR